MESKLFSIGDIVALKTHPYLNEINEVVLSGDHVTLSPLMVVVGIFKSKTSEHKAVDIYKYTCIWFSTKSYQFETADILEEDLKIISENISEFSIEQVRRGSRIILKTASLELGKKKSSLSWNAEEPNSGTNATTINSLLTFLAPVMQVIEVKEHKSNKPIKHKSSGSLIREVHKWDVKFSIYNPQSDRISEFTQPLEAFNLLIDIEEETLKKLQLAIQKSKYLRIISEEYTTLVKPILLSYRSGNYYLNAYDYVANIVIEFKINNDTVYKIIKPPFLLQVPKFDISKNPKSATPTYIIEETIAAINKALKHDCFIRIKYKNRNDKLSFRTIKNYKLIKVKENRLNVVYLVGYCLMRKAERSFRVDRIQSLQVLKLKFK